MKLLLPLIFATYPLISAHADDWNDASLAAGKYWNEAQSLFADPFAATVWGCLKEERDDLSDDDRRMNSYFLASEFYGKKQEVYLTTQKAQNSPFTKKAPLMVILPGLFTGAYDGNEIAKANRFAASGYHVLVLPNPWSGEALGDRPNFKPGDIENEGKWVLSLIRTAVDREINPKYVSSISVYGESYGAILAGIVAGLDDAKSPLITGKVMMVSPPLDMMTALLQLDASFNDTQAVQAQCRKDKIKIGLNFLMAKSDGDLKPQSRDCAKALVAMQFNDSLYGAMSAIQRTNLDVPRTPFQARFAEYIQSFAPEQKQMCDTTQKCKLSYWIEQARAHGKQSLAIASAMDDFLNTEALWQEMHSVMPQTEQALILLKWGGHLGYIGTSTFENTFYTN